MGIIMIINSKLKLKQIIETYQKQNKTVLIKKGVFDIIHPGHIYAISQFKKKADIVIILIQSDSFTKLKKGKSRPINSQKQRAEVVSGIKGVDYIFLDKCNSREEYIKLLNYLKPNILAVTALDSKKTKKYKNKFWKLLEFPDKNLPGYSTTEIINKILTKCKKKEINGD